MSALNEVGPERPTNSAVPVVQRPAALPIVTPVTNAHVATPMISPSAAAPARKIRENTAKLHIPFKAVPANTTSDEIVVKVDQSELNKVFKTDGKELPDLSRAVVTRVAHMSLNNQFPYPIKLGFLGQDSAHVSIDGHEADIFMYQGETHRGNEVEIYNAKKAVDEVALEKYGHTSLNGMLDSITLIKGTGSALVPVNHEVIRILEKNTEKYGAAPSAKDIIDGHYKLDGNIVRKAIQDLHNAVLTRFKFTNLAEFAVTIKRQDNKHFNDVEGSIYQHLPAADAQEAMSKLCFGGLDLKLDWIVPQKENTANKSVVDNSVVQHYQPSNIKVPVAAPK